MDAQSIEHLLDCRPIAEYIECITSLNLDQLDTRCYFGVAIGARGGIVEGTPNVYGPNVVLVYIIDYGISLTLVCSVTLIRPTMTCHGWTSSIDIWKYIKGVILQFNTVRHSSEGSGISCEDVIGMPL